MDFANTCRACMRSDQILYPLFFDNVSDIFMTCTELKISENDNLPQKICSTCTRHLEASYQFKLQCQMSEASFISYLKDNSNSSGKPLPIPTTVEKSEPYCNETDVKLGSNCDVTDVKSEPDNESVHENNYKENLNVTSENPITSNDESSNNRSKSDKINNSKLKIYSKKRKIYTKTAAMVKPTLIECSKCKKQFSHISSLKRHIQSCNKILSCGLCDFECDTDNEFNLHLQSCRAEINKFDCHTCGIAFRLKSELTNHRLRIHDTRQPLSCNHCEKLFKNERSLHNHTRWITNQKKYKCTICGKIFSFKSILRTHMITHSGIKPYKCVHCKKNFRTRSHLVIHLRLHTRERPYVCDVCKKTFTSSSTLKRHKLQHSDVRVKYSCKICNRSYFENSKLNRHMRSHDVVNEELRDELSDSNITNTI